MAVQWIYVHFFPNVPTYHKTAIAEDDVNCPHMQEETFAQCIGEQLVGATSEDLLDIEMISQFMKEDGDCDG